MEFQHAFVAAFKHNLLIAGGSIPGALKIFLLNFVF